MKQSPSISAGIYARISRDSTSHGLGVERQLEDCRKLADATGWNVVEEFVDNDISAYSGKHRPRYQDMLQAIEDGRISAILAYHPDRLHRRTSELDEFVSFVEKHGVEIQTVGQGTYDLTTSSGRLIARVVGATSQHEVERMQERQLRSKQQMLEQGKYRGGPRPYGFENDGVTIREAEAQVIRDSTTSIIAGRTLAAVARELNEQGLKTSMDKSWTYARLKEVLIRPRNAGLIARGVPGRKATVNGKRHPFEVIGKAEWDALVPDDQWRTLISILTDPGRRKYNHGNNPRWFGSGFYECGKCGGDLRPAPYSDSNKTKNERRHLYRCTSSAHLTISADKTDTFVRQVVAELLNDGEITARMMPENRQLGKDRTHRASLVTRLEQFETDYIGGKIDQKLYNKATEQVLQELQVVDERLSQAVRHSATTEIMDSTVPVEAFWAAPVALQKAVAKMLMRVVIRPVARRGMQWSSDRVEIIPLTESTGKRE